MCECGVVCKWDLVELTKKKKETCGISLREQYVTVKVFFSQDNCMQIKPKLFTAQAARRKWISFADACVWWWACVNKPRLSLVGMGHNWLTISHQCGLSERTPSSPPPLLSSSHSLFPRWQWGSRFATQTSSSSYSSPSSLYLFIQTPKTAQHREKNEEGWEGWRRKKKEEEGGRQTHKHTTQVQLHTRGRDTHTHCAHTHMYTLSWWSI